MFDIITKTFARFAGKKKDPIMAVADFEKSLNAARAKVASLQDEHREAILDGKAGDTLREITLKRMDADAEVSMYEATRAEFLEKAVTAAVSPDAVQAAIAKAEAVVAAERVKADAALADAKRLHLQLCASLSSLGAKPAEFPKTEKPEALRTAEHRVSTLRNEGEEILTAELLKAAGASESTVAECVAIAANLGVTRREADFFKQREAERKVASTYTKSFTVTQDADGKTGLVFSRNEKAAALAVCANALARGVQSQLLEVFNELDARGIAINTDLQRDITPEAQGMADEQKSKRQKLGIVGSAFEESAPLFTPNNPLGAAVSMGFNG